MSIPGAASPLFLTSAAAAAAGYQINRSLRFSSADSAYLGKTFSSAGSTTTWTLSFWIKRVKSGGTQNVFMSYNGSSIAEADYANIEFNNSDQLSVGYAYGAYKRTNRVFRDFSSWYHIVIRLDTENSTASDRVQIYVNGVKETSFAATHDPDLGQSLAWNKAHIHRLASEYNQFYADCYLTEIYFIDGQALAASDFGEYDSNSVWQPKEFTGTYGPLVDQSQTWSSSTFFDDNGHSYYNSGGTITDLFDNVLGSSGSNGEWALPVDGGTFELNFTQFSSATTVTFDLAGTGNALKINGSFVTIPGSGSETTATFNVSGLTKIEWLYNGGSNYCYLGSISVDGVLLVDSTVSVTDNSFYLKFADNSSNAALGTDSSGNSNTWTVNNLTAAYNFGLTKAANILGTSKYFQFPITYATTVTYEYFIKITTNGTYNYGAKEQTTNEWNIGHTGNSVLFGNFNTGHTTFNSTGLNDGEWHFVRLTTTGSSTSLYVDGSLIATNSSGGNVSTGSEVTNRIEGTGSGEFHMAHLRITTGGTPPTTGVPDISTMNAAAGSGGTLAFYDKLDDIASSGTKTSDGGNVTITMSAATVGVTDPNADSLLDTPTNGNSSDDTGAGGEVSGNYCTFNALNKTGGITLSNGNLDAACTANSTDTVLGTIAIPRSGKYYFEFTIGSNYYGYVGISNNDKSKLAGRNEDGRKYTEAGHVSTPFTSFTTGDVIGVALNNNTTLTFYKNGVAESTTVTVDSDQDYFPFASFYNATFILNAGQRAFAYSLSNHKTICTTNLADPTIADGSTAFDIDLYTGTNASLERSNFAFSPDFLWFKSRNAARTHVLIDTVRGRAKALESQSNGAEYTSDANRDLVSFDSDGFTVGQTQHFSSVNRSGDSIVVWGWDAGTSTVSNTDGSITSSIRANQTVGFSVVTATQGSGNSTWGHGLNAKPDWIIMKAREQSYGWYVSHSGLANQSTKFLNLHNTNAEQTNANWFASTEPTSSVITTKAGGMWNSGDSFVAYCWTAVAGYSAFGSYTGNGSTDGTFVFTGMRPAFILVKNASSADDWCIADTTRSTHNVQDETLFPNSSNAEDTGSFYIDILSNGFKPRHSSGKWNSSGHTFIYAAFAEHPFKTARAR